MRSWPLIVVALAGCASEAAERGWTLTETDGVRLVEVSVAVASLPEYAIVGEADLVIGSRDGAAEYVFGRVGEVRSLPGLGLLVTDAQDQTVRLYDEAGLFLRRFGGRGDGPGEFRLVQIAGVAGDSIWAWDPIPQRLTLLLSDEGAGSMTTFRHEPVERPFQLVRLDDGSYLARSRYREVDPRDPKFSEPAIWMDSLVLRHLDPSGADRDTIAVLADREMARDIVPSNDGDGRPIGAYLPFGAETHWTSDGRGGSVTVDGRTGAITTRDVGGRMRAVVRFTAPPPPLPSSEVARLREARLEGTRGRLELVRLLDLVFSQDVLPETMPRASAVRVGSDGAIWVAEYATFPDEVDEWTVFSAAGEPLGRVRVPQRFEVHEIGPDYLLGVQRDESGVEYVHRLPMERRIA